MCSLLSSKHGTNPQPHEEEEEEETTKEGDQDGGIPEREEQRWQESGGDVHVTRNAVLGGFPRHSAGVIDPVAYAHRTKSRRVCVFDLEVVMGGKRNVMGSQRRRGDPGAFGLARGGLNGGCYIRTRKASSDSHRPARATLPRSPSAGLPGTLWYG